MTAQTASRPAEIAGAVFSVIRDPAVMTLLVTALAASREQAARNSFAGRAKNWLEVLREPMILAALEVLVYTALRVPKPPTVPDVTG